MPVTYTSKKEASVPEVPGLIRSDCCLIAEAITEENNWCEHVTNVIGLGDNASIDTQLHVSWAAYHSNKQEAPDTTSISALLPLFPDDSKTTAMMKHAMTVVKENVSILNPGQVSVIACDQPLFKLAKEIQWTWPETHGEDSFIIMLGGLHIKMALQKAVGDLLDGSGWTSVLEQAGVASPGTADSFLKAAHVKRTARAHQLTACALYNLRHQAFLEYQHSQQETLSFDNWCHERADRSPQFLFWQVVLGILLNIAV